MSIKKRGDKYDAVFKYNGGAVVLGSFDCRDCAQHAVKVASMCIDTNWGEPRHGHFEYAILEAAEIGIKEQLESHFGFELSWREAAKQEERLCDELVEYKIEKALKREAERAAKRSEFHQSRKLLKAIPMVDVEYPAVPRATIPAHEEGDGLPESSGVYFVWCDDEVVYVGQAVNLRNRVRLRHEQICSGDRVSWLEFPCAVLNYAEAFYIGIMCPSRNFGKFQQRHELRMEAACD